MSKKLVVLLVVSAVLITAGISAVSALADSNAPAAPDESVSLPAGSISADQAKQAAEQATGGTASKVESDDENGTLVYEVTAGNQEVKVDAANGQVVKVESDDSDDQSEDGQVGQEVEDGQPDTPGDSQSEAEAAD